MILMAARSAWAPLFCTSCEKLFHYQLEDVMKAYVPIDMPPSGVTGSNNHGVGSALMFYVVCKCGRQIEVGRK